MTDFALASLSPVEVELASLKPLCNLSYGRRVDGLAESIKTMGLLRPSLIWTDGADQFLLAGQMRKEALLSLGRTTTPALILPLDFPKEKALALALADNRERGWNQAETALTWRFLVDDLGAEPAAALAVHLDLAQSPKLRQWCFDAAELPDKGLAALAEGRLDLECGARLARWAPESALAVLDLFDDLNPSKQKKKQWLDWLEDVGRREKTTPVEILASDEIRAALAEADRIGRPAAEEAARKYLWSRRHPLLAELAAKRQACLRSLNLPRSARLELDPTFEDLKFSLELSFSTPADFAKLAEAVAGLRNSPDFQQLLDDDHEQ